MIALVVVEAVAIGLLGLLVAGLLRSHAEILRQLHELGAGFKRDTGERDTGEVHDPAFPGVRPGVVPPRAGTTPAFDVAGVTPGDEAVAFGVAGAPVDTLLAFLSSGCATCEGFWRELRRPERLALPDGVRLVVVTKGPADESESAVRALAPPEVPVVMSSQAWSDYQVPGSPYFLYVHGPSATVVGEGAAGSWRQVVALMRQALADTGPTGGDPGRPGHRDAGDGAYREARADRELLAAGIHPGHPSLYPTEPPEEERP